MERSTCRRNTPPVVRISAAPPYFFVVRRILYSPVPGQMCGLPLKLFSIVINKKFPCNQLEMRINRSASGGRLLHAFTALSSALARMMQRSISSRGQESGICKVLWNAMPRLSAQEAFSVRRTSHAGRFVWNGAEISAAIQCGKVSGG